MATLGKIRRGLNIRTLVGSKLENFPAKFDDAENPEEDEVKATYASHLSPSSLSAVAMDGEDDGTDLQVEADDFRTHWLPQVTDWPPELAEDAAKDESVLKEFVAEEKKMKVMVPQSVLVDLGDAIVEDRSTDDESPEDEEDIHYESLVVVRSGKGKIHLPRVGDEVAAKCGARSENFAMIGADEAMPGNLDLCRRCFGQKEVCGSFCSHKKLSGGRVLRCGRRCCLQCEEGTQDVDDRVHACLFHTEETMLGDVWGASMTWQNGSSFGMHVLSWDGFLIFHPEPRSRERFLDFSTRSLFLVAFVHGR